MGNTKETEIGKDYLDYGLRTPEQVAYMRHVLGDFIISSLGDKIYKLPGGGGYCGQDGWNMFQKALEESFKKLNNGK